MAKKVQEGMGLEAPPAHLPAHSPLQLLLTLANRLKTPGGHPMLYIADVRKPVAGTILLTEHDLDLAILMECRTRTWKP